MEFSYIAATPAGTKQRGLIEANNEKEVVSYLRSNQLIPIRIKTHDDAFFISAFKRVGASDLVVFTRQLSSMILTGLTLVESLSIIRNQSSKPEFKNIVNDLIDGISGGESFSTALAAHPRVFSKVYIALIKAAETSGLLDKVLARLADNLEKSEDLKKKIRSAFFYPAIVVIGIIVVIAIMNIVVIPQLGSLYTSLNVKLPFTTQVVLAFSSLTVHYYFFVIPIGIGFYLFYQRFKRTDSGLRTIDRIKLKLPVLGNVYELSILNEMCRTLSLLINSGTSIIQALTITADTTNNVWYRDAIQNSVVLVEKGVSISDALAAQKLFPPIIIQMVKVGESSGKIDESLQRVSEYFGRDLDLKVKTLTTAMEPILIVTLGVTVGFLILSVITPLYSLISNIQ